MTAITQEIVKPKDCVIGLGIPYTREAFQHDRSSKADSYASFYRNWLHYEACVVKPFGKLVVLAKKLKVDMVFDLRYLDIRDLFCHRPRFKVVIMISHYDQARGTIELSDTDVRVSDFIEEIPIEFSGFLDSPCCNIEELGIGLRHRRPSCLFRYRHGPNDPDVWFAFYRVLLTYLRNRDVTYLQAVEDVVGGLTKT